MIPIKSHNAYHLGDNLIHLNFLRKAAIENPDREFVHYSPQHYRWQLQAIIDDVPNVKLADIDGFRDNPPGINAWRGADQFWYWHKDRNDFIKFHVEAWFPHLAEQMKIDNPIRSKDDMLFDCPSIKNDFKNDAFQVPFDVLVINSTPQSGQFLAFDKQAIYSLVWILLNAGHKVISTAPVPSLYDDGLNRMIDIPCTSKPPNYLSAAQIGHLSLHCKVILMVATGPCWTTFNVWNQGAHRIIMLNPERIYLVPNTVHCTGVPAAALAMQKAGLI